MNKLFLLPLGLSLLISSANAQTQIYGGNTYQTFASAGTISGASSNTLYKLYAAVGQPIAFSSATLGQRLRYL